MKPLRDAHSTPMDSSQIRALLAAADTASEATFRKIVSSRHLTTNKPASKNADLQPCVCLSECTLPGLLGLAERYGRFGFVFGKDDLLRQGARPCSYLVPTDYARLKKLLLPSDKQLFSLFNRYEPRPLMKAGARGQPQDFTHEREWRTFAPIDLATLAPVAVLIPSEQFSAGARQLLASAGLANLTVLTLDMMFHWGV